MPGSPPAMLGQSIDAARAIKSSLPFKFESPSRRIGRLSAERLGVTDAEAGLGSSAASSA